MRYVPLLAVGALLASGCGTPPGDDPGDRRLHELRNDRVFSALPAGATSPALTQVRARGRDRPSVVATFGRPGPSRAVFRFYARRAAAAGWRATADGALDVTDRWAKSYPDGASATLLLMALPSSGTASAHRYRLVGSISLRAR